MSEMRRLTVLVLFLAVASSAWEEYDEDDYKYWNRDQYNKPRQESWPPTTRPPTRPTSPTTRCTTTQPRDNRPEPEIYKKYDEDDYKYWNPDQYNRPKESWPPTTRPTTRPTSPTTRRTTATTTTTYRPREYRPAPDECDQARANQMADRIYEQLMREANGNPIRAISVLESRFNIRPPPGCSPYERLGPVVNAASARITSAGYGYYRPVIHAVADRLADALHQGGTINVNVRPAQGSSGGFSATVTFSGSSNNNQNSNNRPTNNRNNGPNWWSETTTQRPPSTTTRPSGWWAETASTSGTQRATTTTRPSGWWRPSSRDLEQLAAQNSQQGTPEQVEDVPEQDQGMPGMWEMLMQDHYSLFDYHHQPSVN